MITELKFWNHVFGLVTRGCLNKHSKLFLAAHFLGLKQRRYEKPGSLKKITFRGTGALCLSVLPRGCIASGRLALQPANGTTLDREFKDLREGFELGEHICQI